MKERKVKKTQFENKTKMKMENGNYEKYENMKEYSAYLQPYCITITNNNNTNY